MSGPSAPHISNPRFQAALHAGQLPFILEHFDQITPSLTDEIKVCRLIAEQEPERLGPASAQWIHEFAGRLAALGDQQTLGDRQALGDQQASGDRSGLGR